MDSSSSSSSSRSRSGASGARGAAARSSGWRASTTDSDLLLLHPEPLRDARDEPSVVLDDLGYEDGLHLLAAIGGRADLRDPLRWDVERGRHAPAARSQELDRGRLVPHEVARAEALDDDEDEVRVAHRVERPAELRPEEGLVLTAQELDE